MTDPLVQTRPTRERPVAPVTVAVLASEPLIAQGAVACLPDQLDRASVVLIFAGEVGEETLALLEQAGRLQALQRDVLDPHGLTTAGLYTREVDVLRLLAEGLDTAEVSQRLNYSERTVRNIIHGMLTRMKLRNRVHAVAFALRNGVM
jgi:DNA-binding NarL/FixJ family response regulator